MQNKIEFNLSFSRKKHIFAPSINHGMKKLLITFVALSMMACGNKTKSEQPVADSTTVEIPDTLYTVEAVIKQVNAVYEYWNQQRLHDDEKAPTVDERFGSKVRLLRRHCQCQRHPGSATVRQHCQRTFPRQGCRYPQGRPHPLDDASGGWSMARSKHLLRVRRQLRHIGEHARLRRK